MLSVRLRHKFEGFVLDAAFEAPAGLTVLFGPSGSGKTTVVNAVAGLLRPQSGRIAVGADVLTDSARGLWLPPHRRGVGYVFQDARLFPHLTVGQNLLYGHWFAARGRDRPADLGDVVDLLGIGHLLGRRPAALSGGERQRVALGRALLSHPRLLLMDEPLAALDQARKDDILPHLERLRDHAGLPILYVSHATAEVARLATHVVVLAGGTVAAAGPVGEVLSDPALAPLLGQDQTGAVLTARIAAQEPDGLTRLATAAGALFVPAVAAPPGTLLRLRILAQDVMIATGDLHGISALNVIPARIRDLTASPGGVLVRLDAGDQAILSRITARSATALGLAPGMPVQAVLKAVSVAPGTIGISGG